MSLSTFIPPAVAQLGWRGAQFGLPWLTNITFGTAVNRDLLAQAGFDPERTPVYVSDVEAINRKVTRFDVEGRVVQLGMPPHLYTGEPANTLTSWGFAFGGGFWDSRDQRFTTDRPENTAALEWLFEQKQRYLPDDDTSLLRAASGPVFGGGRIGVILIHTSAATDLHHHFPDLDWRLGPQPYLEDGGHRNPLWLSGPALTITRDSEDPEAAFSFVRYATTYFDALEALVSVGRSLPGVLEPRAIWEVVRRDRALAPWVDMLADVRFSRPPVPNQRFWVATLNERVTAVLNGRLPAATALAEAQRLVSEDLSR
ncbi:MAG TPA: extracellular solute-binding protein, partial [Limnochordia bacterium]